MEYVLEIQPDDSPGSDKNFDQVIEEEIDVIEQRQPNRIRSTKEQLALLDSVMDDFSDGIDEEGWKVLGIKLNDLGPPERTFEKWKRVWTVRKYHQKSHESVQPSVDVAGSIEDSEPLSTTEIYVEMLQRQDTIIDGLEKVELELRKTNQILETKLDKTNSLLEIIAKSCV